ncbi:uncharacterized protein METZ01_LOCUS67554 [marine metagenome]|uniref:Uncharacterized protein n=1 Tax=marine metagenome TaxID=408172 RepID=A0A381TF36_9ZZZZ
MSGNIHSTINTSLFIKYSILSDFQGLLQITPIFDMQ